MFVYYAITFYILRSFNIGISYKDLFFVICGTSFAITTCVFIPTPGGSGGIEFAFTSIFVFIASGITKDLGASGMLLWRILTYYGLMLVSFIDYLVLEKRTLKFQKYTTINNINTDNTNVVDLSIMVNDSTNNDNITAKEEENQNG